MTELNSSHFVCVKLANFLLMHVNDVSFRYCDLKKIQSQGKALKQCEIAPQRIDGSFTYFVELAPEENRELAAIDLDLLFRDGDSRQPRSISTEIMGVRELSEEELSITIKIIAIHSATAGNISNLLSRAQSKFAGLSYAIDRAEFYNNNLFVHGWIENAGCSALHIISSCGTNYAPPSSFQFRERSDVAEVLKADGRAPVTELHGFSVSVPLLRSDLDTPFEIYVTRDDELAHIGNFVAKPLVNCEDAALFYWQCHSGHRIPPVDVIEQIVRPLLTSPSNSRFFTEHALFELHQKPRLSVVVPLYGEWFFIKPLVAMQKILPPEFEWIFVCDDPRIEGNLMNFLESRSQFYNTSTKLVVNRENYGYSAANNIGCSVSTAEVICFMNSDIWIADPSGFLKGLAAVENGVYDLIGFRLQFEDGSLQHDGISFRRNRGLHNLYLAEHDRKGLPPDPPNALLSSSEAVTAALMVVNRRSFEELGGFDPIYIRGDFEDADLCLRFRSAGKKIGIVRDDSCFHLERQSIRSISSIGLRQAITIANCITFNRRWSNQLDESHARGHGK